MDLRTPGINGGLGQTQDLPHGLTGQLELLVRCLLEHPIRSKRILRRSRSRCLQCLLDRSRQCHDHPFLLRGNGQFHLLVCRSDLLHRHPDIHHLVPRTFKGSLLEVLESIPLTQPVMGGIQLVDLHGGEENLLTPLGASDPNRGETGIDRLLRDLIPSNEVLCRHILHRDRRQGPIGFIRREGHRITEGPTDQFYQESRVYQVSIQQPSTDPDNHP